MMLEFDILKIAAPNLAYISMRSIQSSLTQYNLCRHRWGPGPDRLGLPIVISTGHCSQESMVSRVQWFWLFFTFWGKTTHPWHPKGPRIWKLAKKIFQLHPWPAEIFGKNRKMRIFGLVSKFNFKSPVWQIFTIFSACFIMKSLIHIQNLRSLSQKL